MATILIRLDDTVILINEDTLVRGYREDGSRRTPIGILSVAQDLATSKPWLNNKAVLKNYLTSLFVEEYKYEKYSERHGLDNPYIWGGNLFTEEGVSDEPSPRFLNSGIHSDEEEDDIYINLLPQESQEGDSSEIVNYYLLEFSLRPEEVSSSDCICCFNIFDTLPIKKCINLKRLFGSDDIKPKRIAKHILTRDSKFEERKRRLPVDYQSLLDENEEALCQKLVNDISYSLDIIHKCPYLAIPITLNLNNTSEDDLIIYVGQFAIPLYRSDDSSVYAALPLSCKDAVAKIGQYKKAFEIVKEGGYALSSLGVEAYTSYLFCSYTCKTILSLDMVRDDCLFILRGNNIDPILWFNNKKLKGVVDKNGDQFFIHTNNYDYNVTPPFNLEVGDNVCFNAVPTFYHNRTGKLRWKVGSIYSCEHMESTQSEDEDQSSVSSENNNIENPVEEVASEITEEANPTENSEEVSSSESSEEEKK